jgi:hypothetical protein
MSPAACNYSHIISLFIIFDTVQSPKRMWNKIIPCCSQKPEFGFLVAASKLYRFLLSLLTFVPS